VISISGALKSTDPRPGSEWTSLASLLTLLILRAVFYWNLGPPLKWTATINLVPVSLPMRSDLFPLMLIYSFASFGLVVGLYIAWLLLLSAVNSGAPLDNVIHKFVRMQLGFLDKRSRGFKLALPMIAGAIAWACAVPVLQHYGIIPPPHSKLHLIEQSFVVGLSAILGFRGILFAVLAAQIVNNYLFLGNHPLWAYVEMTASKLRGPLQEFRSRLFDAGSFLLLSLVIVLSYIFSSAFLRMFASLPW
jgi:hypothetical protein